MKFIFGTLLIISSLVYSTLALPPCTCTRILRPVCGSDGEDYANVCLLECAEYTSGKNITVAKEGPCNGTLPQVVLPEICICPDLYEPVCGTDGQTYSNECQLNCHNASFNPSLKIEHTGRCKTSSEPSAVCPLIRSPVCGSDGVTYSNSCILNAATKNNSGLSVVHQGPCKDSVNIKDF